MTFPQIMSNIQEAVDWHIDLNHIYWERSAPRHQCSPVHLLIPASSTLYTHKVRFTGQFKKGIDKNIYWDEENRTRWMPDGDEDISWPWIKEALPSINLTKVLVLSFCPFHPCTHIQPFCPAWHSLLRRPCAGYLSDCWDPLHPNAIPVQPSFIGYL